MNPHRPSEEEREKSADLTARIVEMRDKRGLSWRAIASRLGLSHAAVWQRYQRKVKSGG